MHLPIVQANCGDGGPLIQQGESGDSILNSRPKYVWCPQNTVSPEYLKEACGGNGWRIKELSRFLSGFPGRLIRAPKPCLGH